MEVERLQSAKVFGKYADVGEVGENVCGVGCFAGPRPEEKKMGKVVSITEGFPPVKNLALERAGVG